MNVDLSSSNEDECGRISQEIARDIPRVGTILIVEDDEDLAELLEYQLRQEGYVTVIASDGVQASRLFEEVEVDLVLLDILLPELEGWAVCRLLRQHPDSRIASTPVIMLTALSAQENRIRGIECGADVYLTKPYSIKEVVLNCQRLISARHEKLGLQSEITLLQQKEKNSSEMQRMLFHELRSHFTVIGGLCHRMLRGEIPLQLSEQAGSRGYLEVIRNSVSQLSDLADEMLLMSRLRSTNIQLPTEEFHLSDITEGTLAVYRAKARMKGVDIVTYPIPTQPVRLHRAGMKIILSSLLENAVKYCPADSVVLIRFTVDGGILSLEVRDQGPGIHHAEHEKIFEPYYRSETVQDTHQGNGLGLYSVKRLSEAMHGMVGVESAPATGSRFWVRFNMEPTDKPINIKAITC